MSLFRSGGYFGTRATPATNSAPGVWRLEEAESARRGNVWPGIDPFSSNVSLLLPFDGVNGGTTFTDSSTNNLTPTLVNSPTTSTTRAKFGQSGYFAGTSYLSYAPNSTLFAFGTGNFTVEYWLFVVAYNSRALGFRTSGVSTQFDFFVSATGQIGMWNGSTTTNFSVTGAVGTGTWHHVAWSRQSGSVRAYLNGVQQGSTATITTSLAGTSSVQFPANSNYQSAECYLDELRITKGVARYTGTSFAVQTEAFR